MATSISPLDGASSLDTPFTPIVETAPPRVAESEAIDVPEANGFSGVHDVFKTVDHWFERETHQIEREADRLAEQWANENLPTLTGVGEETLPPEEVLARLCGELWQRWPERVQVKMQDAIDSASTDLSRSVGSARAALVEMRVSRGELKETEQKIEQIRADMESKKGKVRYDALISQRTFWVLSVLLIIVEFIANQPVFRLIWPMQPAVEAVLADRIEAAVQSGFFAGPLLAFTEAVSYFEASIIAFSVVLVLFVLAKYLGGAVRPLLALREEDHPFSSRSIASLHRQKRVLAPVLFCGVLAVMYFLYDSRGGATDTVNQRLKDTRAQLVALRQTSDSTIQAGGIETDAMRDQQSNAEMEIVRLQERLSFAQTVESKNTAIFWLNVALVCVAFAVGFMADERDLTDAEGEHPDFQRLREKCTRLNEQLVRYANEAREHVSHGQMALSRLGSLQRSRPLATLEAKRERLGSIIPRWRTTNARIRGLDPVSIAAFRRPVVLALPEISQSIKLARPETVDGNASELTALIDAIYSAEREADLPAIPTQTSTVAA